MAAPAGESPPLNIKTPEENIEMEEEMDIIDDEDDDDNMVLHMVWNDMPCEDNGEGSEEKMSGNNTEAVESEHHQQLGAGDNTEAPKSVRVV